VSNVLYFVQTHGRERGVVGRQFCIYLWSTDDKREVCGHLYLSMGMPSVLIAVLVCTENGEHPSCSVFLISTLVWSALQLSGKCSKALSSVDPSGSAPIFCENTSVIASL
jgi:hypothetical protein